MKRCNHLFQFFLLSCLCSWSLAAQSGAIRGTVIDEQMAEPLIGANVVIEGTSIGSPTDFDGNYQFQVDPGVYTIVVTYLGYETKKITDVQVIANETYALDITMGDATSVDALGNGESIIVTARALERTENAVLVLRKKSDKVQDIISLQEIQRLGAGTAAAALTKVTGTTIVDGKYVYVRGLGDRYSSTSLNGLRLPSLDPYRNSAQLDLIPTNLVDNIVASKTFTPDLPGDFTGGNVNIKMKDLPERFTMSVSTSVGYNTQVTGTNNFQTFNTGGMSWLGYDDGTLARPDIFDNPRLTETGALVNSAGREARRDEELAGLLDQAVRSFDSQMTPTTTSAPVNHGMSFSLGNQFDLGDKPLGLLFSFNYSRSYSHYDNGINASYALSPGESDLFQNFRLQDTRSVETPELGSLLGLSFRPSPNNSLKFYGIYSHQTDIDSRVLSGDQNDYGIGAPDLFVSNTLMFRERSLIDLIVSGEHVLPGLGNTRIEWAGSRINTQQNEPDLRFFAYGFEPGEPDRYFTASSAFDLPSRFFRSLEDQSYEAKLDVTVPFLHSKHSGNKLKFGGLYNTTDRTFNENQYLYNNRQGQNFNGAPSYYFGDENIGVIAAEPDNNTVGLFIVDDSKARNNYVGDYNIFAAYGMLTYQVSDRLKFIGGARLEGTRIYVESQIAATSSNPLDQPADIDRVNVLPSANLVWALTDNTNVRAGFSQTIARPNMREVAPFGSFGFIGDPILFGNPDLQLSNIANYDLRFENFFNAGELVAVSAFYKQFDNPIVLTYRLAGNPQYTWKNPQDATLYGAEFEIRKDLDFMGLKNFSFSGNVAYIVSEVDLDSLELAVNREVDPEFAATRDFAGQSPFVVNANLSYVFPDGGWEAALAYNYFDTRLAAAGDTGTPDIFERGRSRLDFNVSKQIGAVTLSVKARNLFDPEYTRFSEYQGTEYTYQRFKIGREFVFGLSYKI